MSPRLGVVWGSGCWGPHARPGVREMALVLVPHSALG